MVAYMNILYYCILSLLFGNILLHCSNLKRKGIKVKKNAIKMDVEEKQKNNTKEKKRDRDDAPLDTVTAKDISASISETQLVSEEELQNTQQIQKFDCRRFMELFLVTSFNHPVELKRTGEEILGKFSFVVMFYNRSLMKGSAKNVENFNKPSIMPIPGFSIGRILIGDEGNGPMTKTYASNGLNNCYYMTPKHKNLMVLLNHIDTNLLPPFSIVINSNRVVVFYGRSLPELTTELLDKWETETTHVASGQGKKRQQRFEDSYFFF